MKKIKLFTIAYFLFFVMFTGVLFAQNAFDLNGSFEGLRKQYDPSQQYFMQDFQYKYDLVQKGDVVTGISTIYGTNGDYAEVKIKGIVVGDKFYFEEYEIVDQYKKPYSVWCYKSGELTIERREDKLFLIGETKSFTTNYGSACTGGYTEIYKTDNKYEDCGGDCLNNKLTDLNAALEVSLFPNPTIAEAKISFDVTDKSEVKIEIYDLSGRLVATPLNKPLDKGTHSTKINIGNESNGLFIVKLTIGNVVFSKQLIKAS